MATLWAASPSPSCRSGRLSSSAVSADFFLLPWWDPPSSRFPKLPIETVAREERSGVKEQKQATQHKGSKVISSRGRKIRSQYEGGKCDGQTKEIRLTMMMSHHLHPSYVLFCKNYLRHKWTGFQLHFLLLLGRIPSWYESRPSLMKCSSLERFSQLYISPGRSLGVIITAPTICTGLCIH